MPGNLPGMPLNIKDAETDALVREMAELTGETITVAVQTATRERMERLRGRARADLLRADLQEIADRCAALPVLDERPADEILGYDADGLPA